MSSVSKQTGPFRLGVLLSGRGSNFLAIQEAIESGQLPNARISVVISNHSNALGLQKAQEKNLSTAVFEKGDYESRTALDEAIADCLKTHQVDLVVLAGYDRIISAPILAAFEQRILNIHPSLLPAYGGKGMVGIKVHQAVLAIGEKESGCSVHLVTPQVDEGPILGQSRVPVLADDTPERLAARVLAEEHRLYPRVIREYLQHHLNREEHQEAHDPVLQ